jgi:hypothetical protein
MGERLTYYKKRHLGKFEKESYVSIITGGMAQNHCNLPRCGNLKQFEECLTQHLQGVWAHGRFLKIYRTYENIMNGKNLQIHTLLLALEHLLKDEKRAVLPDTVFIQIDGGCENISKVCFLIYCTVLFEIS